MRCATWWLLVLAACKTADGTRGQCAEGGALESCPPIERTAEGACWRLVDCGAISLNNPNHYDWTTCANGDPDNGGIARLTSDRQRIVIDCIAASTCDGLKVAGSPDTPDPFEMPCIRLGDPR